MLLLCASTFLLFAQSESLYVQDGIHDSGSRLQIDDVDYLHRYPPINYEHCKRQVKCIRIQNITCMGTKLPYDTTSLDLVPEYYGNLEIIKERLQLLEGLKHIPKCWTIIQPFICSLFMPRCINNTIELPSQEMCKKVSNACRLVLNHTIWPSIAHCNNDKIFPRYCKSDNMRDVKFNISGRCLKPLVPTDYRLAVFDGIEGCGLPCSDPLYTNEEKNQIHEIVFWAASISAALNFFTILTFLIDWRSANKYPALAVFYMNCCFFVSCIGWLMQFLQNSRDFIVCRKDGTLRMEEPNAEDLSCVVVFAMVYHSLIAAMIWFIVFTYTWYMTSQAIGKIQDKIDKKAAYFHLLAWCLPLVLTVSAIAMEKIDGNHMAGICFVGYNDFVSRTWFVIGPVMLTLSIGAYFMIRGLVTLVNLKKSSEEIITEYVSSKIQKTVIRMGLFFVFVCGAVAITLHCHLYEFKHLDEWNQSFRNYIICSITSKYSDGISDCKLESRPSAAKMQLHLLSPFFAGILMSSWIWTSSTLATWFRFFKRLCTRETEEPVKLKKHKVIAQAFAKRKNFDNTGRLSITFANEHSDPVGLNLQLNSVGSQDFSTTWAAALPKLVNRRGAMVERSESSSRRNSTDSQFSLNLRRVSLESRRNSNDSQIALSFSEIKADFKACSRSKMNSKQQRMAKKNKKQQRRASTRATTTGGHRTSSRHRDYVESSVSSINQEIGNRLMLADSEQVNNDDLVVGVNNPRPTILLEMEALEMSINDILNRRNNSP